jgi:transaldolase
MPLETINNFRDHGQVRQRIEEHREDARQTFTQLKDLGIHYDQVTQQLLDEGVQKFADSFHQLLLVSNRKSRLCCNPAYPSDLSIMFI